MRTCLLGYSTTIPWRRPNTDLTNAITTRVKAANVSWRCTRKCTRCWPFAIPLSQLTFPSCITQAIARFKTKNSPPIWSSIVRGLNSDIVEVAEQCLLLVWYIHEPRQRGGNFCIYIIRTICTIKVILVWRFYVNVVHSFALREVFVY